MSTQFDERNRLFGVPGRAPINFNVRLGGNFTTNRSFRNNDYFESSDLRSKNYGLQQQISALRPNTQFSSKFMHDLKWKNQSDRHKLLEINEDNYDSQICNTTDADKNMTAINRNLSFSKPLNRGLSYQNFRSSITSALSSTNRPFDSALGKSMFNSKLQIQENVEENFDEGFRRPPLPKLIRGRNSTMTNRLFSHQNIDGHERDVGCYNDLQVSHFSKRGLDSLHESRLGLDSGNNWMNGRDVACSVSSMVSVKAQVVKLLENLHHSILCIAPDFVADAVRNEFDKVKEKLDEINDVSFAPTIKDMETASVLSHASKYTNTKMPELQSSALISYSTRLVTGKDILKTLVTRKRQSKEIEGKEKIKENYESRFDFQNSKINDTDEDSAFVFKKPKPFTKKKKIKKMSPTKKSPPKSKKNISIRDWYPMAKGEKLVFCGVDENGEDVTTEHVEKRITNRKVLLSNGFECNLIGDPSHSIVSVLPLKNARSLKNGLTVKWRVLQKELSECQTLLEKKNNRKQVKSPKRKINPRKKSFSPKDLKKISSPKKISTPESKPRTRSGRTVKPPNIFWKGSKTSNKTNNSVVSGSNKRKSKRMETSLEESVTVNKSNKKNTKVLTNEVEESNVEVPKKRTGRKLKKNNKSESSLLKTKKVQRKSLEETLNESTHSVQSEKNKSNKRKREVVKEPDPVQKKKIKQDKSGKTEVESFESSLNVSKSRKTTQKKTTSTKQKSPKKAKKVTKDKKVESSQTAETSVDYQDVDFELDDIQVPEVSRNISNPQLSRSQLRLISMETPPLKYFNNNLKILQTTTPIRSPDWCISQRTQSEVKQFQRRREECHRKKIETTYTKTMTKKEFKKNSDNKDLRSVMEWVADKNVRSPQWKSRVLQYVIPSRKQMEDEDEEEDEEN